MKVKYKIEEIRPQIFLVTFKHQYDLCMSFVRYQEYYESSSKKIRGQKVDFFKMMKDYSLRLGKYTFSYPKDWYGFNLPNWVFKKMDPLFGIEGSKTPYDVIMYNIVCEVEAKCKEKGYNTDNFYLIGVAKKYHDGEDKRGIKSIVKHEISHGYYYLNPHYKEEMDKIVAKISKKKRKKLNKVLKKTGYCKEVFDDEIVAYMSTGLLDDMDFMKSETKLLKSFKRAYRKFDKAQKTSPLEVIKI